MTYDSSRDCCKERFNSVRPSDCASANYCYIKPETPSPTPEPTPEPTPAPTACEVRTWYFNSNTDKCDNKDRDDGDDDEAYDSLRLCCKTNFDTPSSSDEYGPESKCPFDKVHDECCEMMYPTWYYLTPALCTNEPTTGVSSSRTYDSRVQCCNGRFGGSGPDVCNSANFCYPEPDVPAATPVPTTAPPTSSSPTSGSTPTVGTWNTVPPTSGSGKELCKSADDCKDAGADQGFTMFYAGSFPAQGCFGKNGKAFWSPGTPEEEAEHDMVGTRVRIYCGLEGMSLQVSNVENPDFLRVEASSGAATSVGMVAVALGVVGALL